MPVSDEIFVPLAKLYRSYSRDAEQDVFLVKNRKKIKVLVDSMWEQTVESLFGKKPRNHLDARRIINKKKHTLTLPDDIQVIDALIEVLGEYDVLVEKSYINISKKIGPLFLVSLKRLCMSLTRHHRFKDSNRATELRTLLAEV